MNGGEVIVCDDCGDPFEIAREHVGEACTCPYCEAPGQTLGC